MCFLVDLFVERMARLTLTSVSWRELVVLLELILVWCTRERVGRSKSAAELSLDVTRRGTVFLICLFVMGCLIVVMAPMRAIVIQIVAGINSGI